MTACGKVRVMVIGNRVTVSKKIKSFHYTRGTVPTPEVVMSGGARLRSLAPAQHSFKETLKWLQTFGYSASDLTVSGIKIPISRIVSDVFNPLSTNR